jgi:two-component system heavy metal sensor histidine kinase CusS
MRTPEALDDQPAAGVVAESRRRALAITAIVRLAAGVAFLVIGIAWTTSKQISMGVVGLPLFVYVALASTFFACGQNAVVGRPFGAMSFLDVGLCFLIFRAALSQDLSAATSWSVVSLAANTLVVALAGLALPLWLVGVVTAADIAAEATILRMAGNNLWPILVAGLALAFVAAATATVQRKTMQALRQSHEVKAALDSLANMRSQNQALERLQREKDSLLELIVHDMRSPVGAALLSLEYIALEFKKSPGQAALLEAVDDGLSTLNVLSGMIAQILDTSKLETGRLTLRLDVVCLRPMIETIVRDAGQRARSRNLALDFEAHEEIKAAVDIRLFPRALEALLSFGLRHSPEGGRVLIAVTGTATETRVSLHASALPVPAEEREHMFDKFPISRPESRRLSAWGLGLYFSKLVVVSHQGTIAVEDVDGWPTSFVIRLPAVP